MSHYAYTFIEFFYNIYGNSQVYPNYISIGTRVITTPNKI